MENIIKVAILGFVIGYILFRLRNKNQKKPAYSDILMNDEYKVKGQWDKD